MPSSSFTNVSPDDSFLKPRSKSSDIFKTILPVLDQFFLKSDLPPSNQQTDPPALKQKPSTPVKLTNESFISRLLPFFYRLLSPSPQQQPNEEEELSVSPAPPENEEKTNQAISPTRPMTIVVLESQERVLAVVRRLKGELAANGDVDPDRVASYHFKLTQKTRRSVREKWAAGELDVICVNGAQLQELASPFFLLDVFGN